MEALLQAVTELKKTLTDMHKKGIKNTPDTNPNPHHPI